MGAQHGLTPRGARALLVRAQRLTRTARAEKTPVADVVRSVAAIQAQDGGAGRLGVRARLAGATAADVDAALYEERSLVRIWCMRATLHFVPADDVSWIVALTGPIALRRYERRCAELGVGAENAVDIVRAVLADGPLDRGAIAEQAARRGLRPAGGTQAAGHLVLRAAASGAIVEVRPQRGRPAYALWEDWLGPRPPVPGRDAMLAELARRHLHAHPPAGPRDLAAWSGLPAGDARRAYSSIAGEIEAAGGDRFVARGTTTPPDGSLGVRLLPAWDSLLLGHRDRVMTVPQRNVDVALQSGGVLRPALLVDGWVEGTWRIERGRPEVAPFGALAKRAEAALRREVADVERFRESLA